MDSFCKNPRHDNHQNNSTKVYLLCIFINHNISPGKNRCVDLFWKKEACVVLKEDAHQEGHLTHDGVDVDTDDSLWQC